MNSIVSTSGSSPSLEIYTQGDWQSLFSHLADFKFALLEHELNQSTLRAYTADIQQHIEWANSHPSKGSIPSREDALAYLDFLSRAAHHLRPNRVGKYAASTIIRKLSIIRRFYAFLCKEGVLPANPFRDIAKHSSKKQPQSKKCAILPAETIQLLVSTCDLSTPKGVRDRALFSLLACLGLRVVEIHQLNVSDIDFTARSICVNKHHARIRLLPLVNPVLDALSRWISVRAIHATCEDCLFISLHHNSVKGEPGLRLSHRGIRSVVDKSLAGIGVTDSGGGPSLLRRSAIHHSIANGVDLKSIQSLFGISPKSFHAYQEFIFSICR